MKVNKRLILVVCVVFLSICPLFANYRIADYKVTVDVNENYVLNVKEDYVFEFDSPRHGFYRVIPYQNYPNHNIKIKNIKVDGGPYKSEKSGGLLTIRVGDPDKTVTGKVDYSISYDFDIGADTYEDFDEFYFNIIGTMWECEIYNASFEVNFPKPIDFNRTWLTMGSLNSSDVHNDLISISSDSKTISGFIDYLQIKEGATLRVEMDDGYFVGARDNTKAINIMSVIVVLVNLLLVFFAFMIFHKYGRDDILIEQSRFDPPDGFTPLSLDYFINEVFSSTSYSASFIHWAEKGYIDIKQYDDDKVRLIRKVNFLDVKQGKDNNIDYKLFTAIFKGSEIGEEIDLEKLDSEKLGIALKKVKKTAESQFDSRLLNDSVAASKRVFILFFVLVSAALSMLFTLVASSIFMPLCLVGSFIYVVLTIILLSSVNSKWAIFSIPKKILIILSTVIITIAYGGVNFINLYLIYLVPFNLNVFISAFTAIVMLVLVLLFCLTEKRSAYTQNVLEQLLGYTSFLKLVEVDQIEKMIDDNPQFYFKHLSYAQVLNLTRVWEHKFAKIDVVQPSWYICPVYGYYSFRTINNVSDSLTNSLNVPISEYTKSHSNSGGSSSSGFSGSVGGGAGGGGGGAW